METLQKDMLDFAECTPETDPFWSSRTLAQNRPHCHYRPLTFKSSFAAAKDDITCLSQSLPGELGATLLTHNNVRPRAP
jgi:hypothetical protein